MSGDEKDPKNPVDEGGKGDSGDKKENDKNVGPSNRDKKERNKSGGEESKVETFDDEMSYEKWKAWKKKKSSSRVIIDSSDGSDTVTVQNLTQIKTV